MTIALMTLLASACTGTIHEPSGTWNQGTANPGNGNGSGSGTDAGSTADVSTSDTPSTGTPDAITGPDAPNLPDSGGGPVTIVKPSFTCGDATATSVSPLRRLSRRQLTHALRDLLAWALGDPGTAEAVMAEVGPLLSAIPAEGGAERMSQNINDVHVEAHYELAEGVAQALTSSSVRLSAIAGNCAVDGDPGNDVDCAADFIASFGLRATRRPVDGAYATFMADQVFAQAANVTEGFHDLVVAFVASPFFVFQVELGSNDSPHPDTYALTAHELASRLSFHLWDTMPDEELLTVATNGTLLDASVYQTQVARLANDPRAAAATQGFIMEWLDIEHVAQGVDPFTALNTPGFVEYAADDLPSEHLVDAMVDDVTAMAHHVIFEEGGNLRDFMTDARSFTDDAELAGIYGVGPWDFAAAPPAFPDEERSGLLTRALFLANSNWKTTVIRKGVFVAERIACIPLGAPPEGADGTVTTLVPPYTERERVENITSPPNCAGCHSVINPLGSFTEAFDSLGRLRADGTEFTHHAATGESWWIDFDDQTSITLPPSYTPQPAKGARQATDILLESGLIESCMVQHYFRFTFAREADQNVDGCVLEAMRAALEGGAPLRDVLRDVALSPAFKLRRVGNDQP